MRIDTEVAKQEIFVEIEDKEYKIAEKTVKTSEKVMKIVNKINNISSGKYMMNSEIWLGVLDVLLGTDAVKELFPDSSEENMDRMQIIYFGCLEAYNSVTEQVNKEQEGNELKPYKEQMKEMKEIIKDAKEIANTSK